MNKRKLGTTGLEVSPLGLGTWVFGGWPWAESKEQDFEKAIEKAIELGINLIDTAPIYGFGKAETIVGRTLKRLGLREKIILATKQGLSWDSNKRIGHDCSKKKVFEEIDASLKRLQTDRIDIYQVHWHDPAIQIGETMEAFLKLKDQGKIRVIGVSNYNVVQMEEALRYAPVQTLQPPYNYLQRDIEKEILPFCMEHKIGTLTYSTLCKGMLTGKFSRENRPQDLVRKEKFDSVFEEKNYLHALDEVEKLKEEAAEEEMTVGQWVIRWTTQQPGVACALIGARNAMQVEENFSVIARSPKGDAAI